MNEKIARFLATAIMVAGLGALVFFTVFLANYQMENQAGLMKHCQDNGYDGIRSGLLEPSECANFTHAEKVKKEYYREKNEKWDRAAEDVFNAFIGKTSQDGRSKSK